MWVVGRRANGLSNKCSHPPRCAIRFDDVRTWGVCARKCTSARIFFFLLFLPEYWAENSRQFHLASGSAAIRAVGKCCLSDGSLSLSLPCNLITVRHVRYHLYQAFYFPISFEKASLLTLFLFLLLLPKDRTKKKPLIFQQSYNENIESLLFPAHRVHIYKSHKSSETTGFVKITFLLPRRMLRSMKK